jgi:hypothetical protein
MTLFLRLLADSDKGRALAHLCSVVRSDRSDLRVFDMAPDAFRSLPSTVFALNHPLIMVEQTTR